MLHMNEPKPDFSTSAHQFQHINREGMCFGVIALAFFCLRTAAILGLFVLPLFLLSYGVEQEVRVGQVMVAGETILGHIK